MTASFSNHIMSFVTVIKVFFSINLLQSVDYFIKKKLEGREQKCRICVEEKSEKYVRWAVKIFFTTNFVHNFAVKCVEMM